MLPVKFSQLTENIAALFKKITVGSFICHTVNRVGEYQPCGGSVELRTLLCFVVLADNFGGRLYGTCTAEDLIYFLYHTFFRVDAFQMADGVFILAAACCDTLGNKAGGRIAAEPASVFCKLHQVVLYTLGQNITLKFRNDRKHLKDDFRGVVLRIDIVGTDEQGDIVPFKVFKQPHKAGGFTSDTV